MEKKRFENKKFEKEDPKKVEKAAKAVKNTFGLVTVLAPIVIAIKKYGVKGAKEGVKLAAKKLTKV